MKEPLKDRFDILLEKAKSGESSAQLKLAHKFAEGSWVEKSIEQAKYWAFKAISAGRTDAEPFYESLYKDK